MYIRVGDLVPGDLVIDQTQRSLHLVITVKPLSLRRNNRKRRIYFYPDLGNGWIDLKDHYTIKIIRRCDASTVAPMSTEEWAHSQYWAGFGYLR